MKFFGNVGFNVGSEESRPGVYEPKIEKHFYTGDISKDTRRLTLGDVPNGKFHLSNKISIIADLYMIEHIRFIEYVEWNGSKWRVESSEVESPVRISLFLGEVYNENE